MAARAKKPAPAADDLPRGVAEHEPVRIVSAPDGQEERTLVLFSIDDTDYRIPAEPRMEQAILLLEDYERYGPELAEMRHLRRTVGEEGWAALKAHKNLRPKDFKAISDAVTKLSVGAMELGN